MSGLYDEPVEYDQIPDEVTLQLRLPTAMAYALRELAKAYQRLGMASQEAAHSFAEHLAEIASQA